MALIDNILNEIINTPEEKISCNFDAWATRCRKEGVSIYSLERLLKLKFDLESSDLRRSTFRFCESSIVKESKKKDSDIKIEREEVIIFHKEKESNFWKRIKNTLGI